MIIALTDCNDVIVRFKGRGDDKLTKQDYLNELYWILEKGFENGYASPTEAKKELVMASTGYALASCTKGV